MVKGYINIEFGCFMYIDKFKIDIEEKHRIKSKILF